MSDAWRADFAIFLADMGHRPSKGHSIDRIDVNGNYCAENCRWATWEQQANNKRSNVIAREVEALRAENEWLWSVLRDGGDVEEASAAE
jgi:hypothetical protein